MIISRSVHSIHAVALRCKLFVAALLAFMMPSVSSGVTIVQSTVYEETLWAQTDLLPGGMPRVFVGVPVPSMLGADTADRLLQDVHIPALNTPVTADVELILLNEKSLEPIEINGALFDFTITLNPAEQSLGVMTFIQTTPDDHGPAPEGVYTRIQYIEFIATLIPLNGGPPIASEGEVIVSTPVPVPFSFDPELDVVLKTGLVGDVTANFHTDKADFQRNFFTLPSLGVGVLKAPSSSSINVRGGGKRAVTAAINGDRCPFDPAKLEPGFTGCGNSDVDSNHNNVPDFYEQFAIPEPPAYILFAIGILGMVGVGYLHRKGVIKSSVHT